MDNNIEYLKKELKVFVADIVPLDIKEQEELQYRMAELENLVSTYGWIVILKTIQKRLMPDYNTYIWAWKLEEIMEEMKREWADILIIWNILKPQQIYKINEKLRKYNIKAWDRVDLILKIFERHAKSAEAKLQIELAAIKHMWPRIFGMWMELSRQWGWIWTRGQWETNTEIMKRHLANKEKAIHDRLEKYKKVRKEHRKARARKNFPTVWIVGYTNAWKSSLLNSITKKWVLAEDKLFATLGTDVGKLYIPSNDWKGREILLNDTIWFIRDLPPSLITAFSSTLEDSIHSDVLLHVIDSSDTKVYEKIKIVDDILEEIWANQPRIYVFNKIDSLSSEEIQRLKFECIDYAWIYISANEKVGLEDLKFRIMEELKRIWF